MDSFADLVDRLRRGDDAAAQAVFDRFARRLIGLARSRVDSGLLHKIDPEDVVQSAYLSFFRRNRDRPFDLPNWNSIWGLLSLITLRKCAKHLDYFLAERRRVGREVGWPGQDNDSLTWLQLVDREPTPEEVVQLSESLDSMLKGFDEEDRPVIEMSLEGYSAREISDRLQRAERSVRRLRERVKKRLLRLIHEEGA